MLLPNFAWLQEFWCLPWRCKVYPGMRRSELIICLFATLLASLFLGWFDGADQDEGDLGGVPRATSGEGGGDGSGLL